MRSALCFAPSVSSITHGPHSVNRLTHKKMTFKEATDWLIDLDVPLRTLADVMGVSHAALIAARLDEGSESHRKPPAGWEAAVLKIADDRAGRFEELAKRLRRGK